MSGLFQSVTTGAPLAPPPRPMYSTRPSGATTMPCGSPIWSCCPGWLGWVTFTAL